VTLTPVERVKDAIDKALAKGLEKSDVDTIVVYVSEQFETIQAEQAQVEY